MKINFMDYVSGSDAKKQRDVRLFAVVIFGGCLIYGTNVMADSPGYSGLAQVGPKQFVTVHDLKAHTQGTRIALLIIDRKGVPQYVPLIIPAWKKEASRPSDLESVCAIPGRPWEILAMESGNYDGRKGRLFHIRIDARKLTASQVHVAEFETIKENRPKQVGDQYEGLACAKQSNEEILLLMGERKGALRWATYKFGADKVTFTAAGLEGKEVSAPGGWAGTRNKRHISSLHVDANGNIWASATQDIADEGPFRSIVYALGKRNTGSGTPFSVNPQSRWVIDGFKVEGLAGAYDAVEIKAPLSFVTEDEKFGGVWRLLLNPLAN